LDSLALAAELDIVRCAKGSRLPIFVASSLASVLALLGALHVFWALGGRLGVRSTVPEVNGKRVFTPTPAATFAVALALFAASALVLGRAGAFSSLMSAALFKWPVLLLGFIFLVRAVGEFKLVGLFKRVRGTSFARWDTWLFSPLCLGISLAALWLSLR
jgi:hypothetical protein